MCARKGESAVVGEAGLELLAGEEDAALDGAEGEVHLLGNLVEINPSLPCFCANVVVVLNHNIVLPL